MISMYDLDKYNTDQEEKTDIDNDTGNYSLSGNGFLNTIWETIKAAARYQVVRMMLFGVFAVAMFAITGDFTKSKHAADSMSTKGASDDYIGLFGAFAKETGHKSTKLNMHPFYHTKDVRRLEQKFELKFGYPIKFSKLFAYVIYEDQDWMVMKSAARGIEREKLTLQWWTLTPGTSADDYCERYFDGFVPNEELKKAFVNMWKIRGIKDELTENSDGEKMFRCVIDSDTIEDYLEDENDRKS